MQVYNILIGSNQQEQTQHGSYDFPFAIYTNQLNLNVLGFINWHWHDEIQFIVITKGEIVVNIEQHSIILKEGESVFINSGILHSCKPYQDPSSTYICINVHPKYLIGYTGSIIHRQYINPYLKNPDFSYFYFKNNTHESIIKALNEIIVLYEEKKFGYEYLIYMMMVKLWWNVINLKPKNNPQNIKIMNARIKEILSYIHIHYREKIVINDIANHVNLCLSECCRIFKKNMNCTISDYIIDFRIEKSLNDLLYSDKSISEVSYNNGFSTPSFFINKFKQKTGITPQKYRQAAFK